MRVLFGWVMLLVGLACCLIAWREWEGGMPPLWTVLSERIDTIVTSAVLGDEVDPSGHHHTVAHVAVAWPPGAESSQEVVGLRPRNDLWHMHTAQEYVRDHPVGSGLTVRDVDGRPMADRTDLRELGYALIASLLALALILPGLALLTGWLGGKREVSEG
jgi:hypothetical protein